MKKFQIIILALLIFSCNANEEIIDIEDAKKEEETQLNEGRRPKPKIEDLSIFTVRIRFKKNTPEAVKIESRNRMSSKCISFSWVVCSSNPDHEIWIISSIIDFIWFFENIKETDNSNIVRKTIHNTKI